MLSPFPGMEPYEIALEQPLPVVPMPLLPEDNDVPSDLAQAFTNVYDAIGSDLVLDYARPPEVLLQGKAATWAARLLATRKT